MVHSGDAGRRLKLAIPIVLLLAAAAPAAGGDVFPIDYSPADDLTQEDRTFEVDGLSVHIAMTRPAVRLQEITFRITVTRDGKPVPITDATLAFNMKMDMGRYLFRLLAEDGAWKAEKVVLPACPSGGVRWYGRLRFTADGRAREKIFLFDLQ